MKWQNRLMEMCGCEAPKLNKYKEPKVVFKERKFSSSDGIEAVCGKITKHSDGYVDAHLTMSDYSGMKTLFSMYGKEKEKIAGLKQLEEIITKFRTKLEKTVK